VPALEDRIATRLPGRFRGIEPDVAQHHGVAGAPGSRRKPTFVAHGIREDGFEDEALALPDQFATQLTRQLGCLVNADAEVAGKSRRH